MVPFLIDAILAQLCSRCKLTTLEVINDLPMLTQCLKLASCDPLPFQAGAVHSEQEATKLAAELATATSNAA